MGLITSLKQETPIIRKWVPPSSLLSLTHSLLSLSLSHTQTLPLSLCFSLTLSHQPLSSPFSLSLSLLFLSLSNVTVCLFQSVVYSAGKKVLNDWLIINNNNHQLCFCQFTFFFDICCLQHQLKWNLVFKEKLLRSSFVDQIYYSVL